MGITIPPSGSERCLAPIYHTIIHSITSNTIKAAQQRHLKIGHPAVLQLLYSETWLRNITSTHELVVLIPSSPNCGGMFHGREISQTLYHKGYLPSTVGMVETAVFALISSSAVVQVHSPED